MLTKKELNSEIEQIKTAIKQIERKILEFKTLLYNTRIITNPSSWDCIEEPISLIELRDEIDAIKNFLEIKYIPATNEKTMVKIKKDSK